MTETRDLRDAAPGWPDDVFAGIRDAGVRQVGFVPDAGHARLIARCLGDNALKTTRLTTEEEGVALALGAWLGGERAALLMQSSGVGNCVNMLSVLLETRSPLLMLVTMRGQWGEFNPWQVPMGRGTAGVLGEMGVLVHEVEDAARVGETVEAAARTAFGSGRVAAVLIGQRVVGRKSWGGR